MDADREYILGADRAELDRLRFQHEAWAEHARALWRRARLGPGDAVLDLGSGPGFTTFELARVVGPTGRVVARDQSAPFLAFLEAEAERLGQHQVELSRGPVEELELPPGVLDAAYARWLFCWLPEPSPVFARVAHGLRPGGVLVLQEYLDWAAMSLAPPSAAFDRAVAACMRSWHEGGGTIDLARQLPRLAARNGLDLEHLAPIARLGAVGSLEWRWLGEFFSSYLPKLVGHGLLGADDLVAFQEDWRARERERASWILAPLMADAILRKP